MKNTEFHQGLTRYFIYDQSTGETIRTLSAVDVSIDNLTVVGRPTPGAYNLHQMMDVYLDRMWVTSKNVNFHYNYLMVDGTFVQLSHQLDSTQKMRIEFNPNKISKSAEKKLIPIFSTMEEPKPTRIDTAIDIYGEDLASYQFNDMKARKKQIIYDRSGRPETIYFGSRASDEQIRIYDKGVEQKLGKGALWWRVEGQLRKEKAEAIHTNPFLKVFACKPQEWEDQDVRTRAMLHYLRAHPEAMSDIHRNSRPKYKQLLAAISEPYKVDFAALYEQKKDDLVAQVDSWLNLCNYSLIQ
jgi:hypothetical protein